MKRKVLALTLIAAAASVASSNIAKAASATANATAEIIAPISVQKYAAGVTSGDLAFGTIIAGSSASTVTVAASDSSRTLATGDAVLISSTYGAAEFSAQGAADASFTVTLPTEAITLSDGDSHTMSVDQFTMNGDTSFDSNGSASFSVGGTLTVGASQVAGSYSGTFSVDVAYN